MFVSVGIPVTDLYSLSHKAKEKFIMLLNMAKTGTRTVLIV